VNVPVGERIRIIFIHPFPKKKVLLSLCNLHMRRNGWRISTSSYPKKNKFSSAPFLGRSSSRAFTFHTSAQKNVPSTNHRISSLCAINYKKELFTPSQRLYDEIKRPLLAIISC
jgi:hypothetical protein